MFSGTKILLAVGFIVSFLCWSVRTTEQQSQDRFSCPVSTEEVLDLFSLGGGHLWVLLNDHARKQFYIKQTTDGGKTWATSRVQAGTDRIYFISATVGWSLKEGEGQSGTFLLRSSDGGKSWRQVSSQPMTRPAVDGLEVVNLAFIDSRHGWFVASASTRVVVYQTSDGGRTLQKASEIPGIGNCFGLLVGRRLGLWIYGQGFVLHSSNGGRSWQSPLKLKELGINQDAFSVSDAVLFADGSGFLIGQSPDGVILSTRDFGKNWVVAKSTDKIEALVSLSFWNERSGCVVGFSTSLTCTSDGGATWKGKHVLPAADYLQCTSFGKLVLLESGNGWVVRDGGYLYETKDEGKSWRRSPLFAATEK